MLSGRNSQVAPIRSLAVKVEQINSFESVMPNRNILGHATVEWSKQGCMLTSVVAKAA